MVSTNDHKKGKIVKGTTAFFKGVVLKTGKLLKEELWNDYRVYTTEANDVAYIVCEQPNKDKTKGFKIFHLPLNTFVVDVKYEMRENNFVTLPKSKLTQFPILIDLATTGHKLQGMTKKNLIVSSLNYGTANWIYVVLSRVTSIKGLFLLQPLKSDYSPKQSRLLLQELEMQRKLEYETLLHLQKNGNFPENIDLKSFISCNNNTSSLLPPLQSVNMRSFEKKGEFIKLTQQQQVWFQILIFGVLPKK